MDVIAGALAFKTALEAKFMNETGLSSRRAFSAVYSLPQQCPLVWLNLNPGGTEETAILLSDEELAAGKHEFFEGHGLTSLETGRCLKAMFQDQHSNVRSVQGSNVVWRRSPDDAPLTADMARETLPFLLEYLRDVRPKKIVFGGIGSYDRFVKASGSRVKPFEVLRGEYRGSKNVRLFVKAQLEVPTLGPVEVVAILHPSKGRRSEVLERLRAFVSGTLLPAPYRG